uniref:Uncharacterized protein n=1 Tax=Panagrolaimus sp. ES5 TaxID=591445 RepID=A0AC34FZ01_9BILA
MKTCILITVGLVFTIFLTKKLFFPRSFDLKKFSTAKGEIDIEEITKNIYEVNGYQLVENGLIPILKRKNPLTCDEVFDEWQKVADKGLTIDPPKEIPNPTEFLLNNYTRLLHWYINETPKNTNSSLKNWNQTYIDNLIEIAKINPLNIPLGYGDEALAVYTATKEFSVNGQSGAVIGSQTPWAEVYLLTNGAKHVTTVDYYELSIKHPQMDFLYAPDLPSKKDEYV